MHTTRRPRYNEDGLFFTQGDKGSLARGIVLPESCDPHSNETCVLSESPAFSLSVPVSWSQEASLLPGILPSLINLPVGGEACLEGRLPFLFRQNQTIFRATAEKRRGDGGRRDLVRSSLTNADGSRNREIRNYVAATEAALGQPIPWPGAPGQRSPGMSFGCICSRFAPLQSYLA